MSLFFLFGAGCSDDAPEPVDEVQAVAENEAAPPSEQAALFPQRDGERVSGGPTKDAACDYLTAARAAELLGLPEADLEEAGSCGYRWRSETHVAEIRVGRVYVYDNLEDSQLSFQTATGNRSAEGTQGEAVEAHEAAAEELEVNGVAEGIIAAAADFEQRYEALEGLGDEAAFAHHDGQVIVRMANMRFAVTAFHCPRPPAGAAPTPAQLRDLEGLAREARARDARWVAGTLQVRREMASQLAEGVVGALNTFRASL